MPLQNIKFIDPCEKPECGDDTPTIVITNFPLTNSMLNETYVYYSIYNITQTLDAVSLLWSFDTTATNLTFSNTLAAFIAGDFSYYSIIPTQLQVGTLLFKATFIIDGTTYESEIETTIIEAE